MAKPFVSIKIGVLLFKTLLNSIEAHSIPLEIIAITITPLEWKANDQKKAEIAADPNKEEKRRDTTPDTVKDEDLPF